MNAPRNRTGPAGLLLVLCSLAMFAAPVRADNIEEFRAAQKRTRAVAERLVSATVGLSRAGAAGSGVIVSEDGLILTAAHVLSQARPGAEWTVVLSDGRRARARSLGCDHSRDAGLARITDGGKWPCVDKGRAATMKPGDWCLATGHPGGTQGDRKPTLRLGRILANGKGDLMVNGLVTDATVAPGDSGGPLFDLDGKVIGIHSNIGLGAAENRHVPIDVFTNQWDDLVKGKEIGTPFAGVKPADDSKGSPNALGDLDAMTKRFTELLQQRIQAGDREALDLVKSGQLLLTPEKMAELLAKWDKARPDDKKKGEPKQEDKPDRKKSDGRKLFVGDRAPDLVIEKWLKGDEVKSFEKGKIYVVEFWATVCPPCVAAMPHLTSLQKKYRDRGVTIIGVTSSGFGDTEEVVRKLLKEKGEDVGYSIALDDGGKTMAAFMSAAGRAAIPVAFIVDRTGKIAYIGSPATLDAVLKAMCDGTWNMAHAEEADRKAAGETPGCLPDDLARLLSKYGKPGPGGVFQLEVPPEDAAAVMEQLRKLGGVLPFEQPDAKLGKGDRDLLARFGDVTTGVSKSVVRVLCDGKPRALGTVVRKDGYIVTKASELSGSVACRIGARELPAVVVGEDQEHDLALLRVKANDLVSVTWADGNEPVLGSWLIAPDAGGKPIGLGVLSHPSRAIGKASPLSSNRATLGVVLDSRADVATVEHVLPDGPAQEAGFRPRDVIESVDGQPTRDADAVLALLGKRNVGDKVEFEIKRAGKSQKLTATLVAPEALSAVRGPGKMDAISQLAGSISKRKDSFPTAFTHDVVLQADQCGGPLLGLDGAAVGINIARADRSSTYAIPAAVLEKAIAKLLAGAR